MKARVFVKRTRVYIQFWLRIALKWFDHGEQMFCWQQSPWICASVSFLQWNCERPPQLNHLVRQHKSPKTCINKGPETNFPEIFDVPQEKIHMTNFLWQMKLTSQFNKQRHLPHKIRQTFLIYTSKYSLQWYLLVCMGLWRLQLNRKASQSIYKITGVSSTIIPSVVCARLYINEFASNMF